MIPKLKWETESESAHAANAEIRSNYWLANNNNVNGPKQIDINDYVNEHRFSGIKKKLQKSTTQFGHLLSQAFTNTAKQLKIIKYNNRSKRKYAIDAFQINTKINRFVNILMGNGQFNSKHNFVVNCCICVVIL